MILFDISFIWFNYYYLMKCLCKIKKNDEKQLKLKVFIKGFFFFKFFFLLFRLTMTQKFLDTVKSALGR